jgi:small neutral amino acid transporter SnatA (MarC family)
MLLFLFTGHAILGFFGITLDSFHLAGDILLLLFGIQIVTGDPAKAARNLVVQVTDWSSRAEQPRCRSVRPTLDSRPVCLPRR